MGIVLLTAAAGSPGVTTSALGLALLWPGDTVLVDVDPHPSQAVLAGYLQGSDGAGRGIAALAGAQRQPQPADLLAHCLPLTTETSPQRVFLPGFSRPGSQHALAGALPGVGQALRDLDAGGSQVIMDAGRFGHEGPPRDLLGVATTVLVLTRSTLRALAALRLHLSMINQLAAHARVGLVLIGEGQPYTSGEIAAQFAVPVLGSVVDDAAGAAVLSEGGPVPRRFAHGRYARSLRVLAEQLADRDPGGARAYPSAVAG